MSDQASPMCGSCNADVELPALFCAMCGAAIAPASGITESTKSDTAGENKAHISQLVLEWWNLEVLKEWSAEVLKPRHTMRQDADLATTGAGFDALRDMARQIEGGGSESHEVVQPREQTSANHVSVVPSFTGAAFAETIKEELTSAGYPLSCTVGVFEGPHAPPGEAVFITPDGIAPLAGEYIYALSISPAGTDILIQPRLTRVNHLKKFFFQALKEREFAVFERKASSIAKTLEETSKEPPPWGNREKLESWLQSEQEAGASTAADLAEEYAKVPPYLPDDLRDRWSALWHLELNEKDDLNRQLGQSEIAFKKKIASLENSVRTEINSLENNFESEIRDLENNYRKESKDLESSSTERKQFLTNKIAIIDNTLVRIRADMTRYEKLVTKLEPFEEFGFAIWVVFPALSVALWFVGLPFVAANENCPVLANKNEPGGCGRIFERSCGVGF